MEYTLNKIAMDIDCNLVCFDENQFEFFVIPDGRIESLHCQVNDFLDELSKSNMIREYEVVVKYADDKDDDFDVLQCEYIATKYNGGELV